MALLRCFLLVFVAISCHVDIAASAVTFSLEPMEPTVSENAIVGTTVATVAASIEGGSQEFTYSLDAQTPDLTFAVDATSGLITISTANMNYETTKTHTIVIEATEKTTTGSKTGLQTGTTTVRVAVTKNEAPTFAASLYTTCVNKSSTEGTTVITVTATDANDGDELEYLFDDGNTDTKFEVSDAGLIKVATGQTVGDTPPSYNLTLVASDGDATASLSGTTTVSVTVGDPCPATTTSSSTATTTSGDTAITTMAPDNSAMAAAIPFHAILVSVVLLLCQFFMKF